MDNDYLHELLREVQAREGGMLLSVQGKTEAVVLSIERYNELLRTAASSTASIAVPPVKHRVLVTGGAGYIGAHIVRQLLASGHEAVVLDHTLNGNVANVAEQATFIKGDVADAELLRQLFEMHNINTVFHLAASIEVEESTQLPLEYLDNNTMATQILLRTMEACGVHNIVFASTAAVYGVPDKVPIAESATLAPTNPYSYSKLLSEHLIQYYVNYRGFRGTVLRFFNVCGSDFDGAIISKHRTHLIPVVMDVISGKLPFLKINGRDYNTFDGTCVRDYVHVLDIARAFILVLDKMTELESFSVYNIGTSKGYSVQEIIQAAAELTGHMIPLEIGPRRPGDVPVSVADNTKIHTELGFELQHSDLETIIKTSWNAVQKNKAS